MRSSLCFSISFQKPSLSCKKWLNSNQSLVNIPVRKYKAHRARCLKEDTTDTLESEDLSSSDDVACFGTGNEVECLIEDSLPATSSSSVIEDIQRPTALTQVFDTLLLISPFFFWGTSMVAMKLAAPHTSPLFVGFIRLFPAGLVLLAWGTLQNRPQPSTLDAWLAISLFGLIDGACFQGFLAEGLQRTTAGLGSIIIDSQPLTVAVLAAVLYNERLTIASGIGLGLGVLGLVCLQLPAEELLMGNFKLSLDGTSLWERGEWWMLLAAQSMAIGTVMVRWVSNYCDPIMATGWHMIIGSIPLLYLCLNEESKELAVRLADFNLYDTLDLTYVTLLGDTIITYTTYVPNVLFLGSAASYGVFFYNASKGNLTTLSSLTFLTPIFATVTGFLVLNETLTSAQFLGGAITLYAVFLINSVKQDNA